MIMPENHADKVHGVLVERAVDSRGAPGDTQLLQPEHPARGRGVEETARRGEEEDFVVAPTLRGRRQTPYHSHRLNAAEEGL